MTMNADGRFAGYASVFNRLDDGRDIMLPGAFRRSLTAPRLGPLPLLWQHDPRTPVGRIETLAEDGFGLRVTGHLTLDVQQGREAWALMSAGALDGLSIGYRVRKALTDPRSRIRQLADVDLVEISLVTFPMQPAARLRPLSTPQTQS
jgi:uncharacterized protein